MPNVEFSEEEAYKESLRDPTRQREEGTRGLTNFVIRVGLAKDETGANIILSGVALLAVILAIAIFAFALSV